MNTTNLVLITENDVQNFEVIVEENGDKKSKSCKIKGPFFMSEKENANKRMYPYEISKPCIDGYIKDKVLTCSAHGELEHSDRAEINLDRVCHRVTSLNEDNKSWIGESIILDGTPCGNLVTSLIRHGSRFGISSRGVGSLTEDKSKVTKYQLCCFDIVADPSIAKFVDVILESKHWLINAHGVIVEAAYNQLEQNLDHLAGSHSLTKETITTAIMDFIKGI
jgi:hypothetical protein